MDADQALEYLRFLRSRIDVLQAASVIGEHEIAPLQSELRLFRDRVSVSGSLSPKLREYLRVADLHVAPVHLAGSRAHLRATWWMHLPWLRFFRAGRDAKDREIIDAELFRLRNLLHDLYCLIEATRLQSS